jgi:hypothetical protein
MSSTASNGSPKCRVASTWLPLTSRLLGEVVAHIDQQLDDRDDSLARHNSFLEAPIEKPRRRDAEESHGKK